MIPNEDIYNRVSPILERQIDLKQGAFGYIYSGLRNVVNVKEPKRRMQIQSEVDTAKQGLLLVYLFALWEEYIERQDERDWMQATDLIRLNAFRHIRHSVAHGFNGGRAIRCRDEFETIMQGADPFKGIVWDNDSIDIKESDVAYDCQLFMEKAAKMLIGRVINDNTP